MAQFQCIDKNNEIQRQGTSLKKLCELADKLTAKYPTHGPYLVEETKVVYAATLSKEWLSRPNQNLKADDLIWGKP